MILSRIVFRPLNMCRNAYRRIFRFVLATYNRLRLRNKDFSVISRDCVGGVLLHELGVRFDSPTVNLYLTSENFVKFCKYLKFYLSEELIEDTASGIDGINSAVKIKDRGIYAAGTVLNYISKYSARKIIDDWDYVSFFNSQG